jgi:hypothetical protein
MQNDRRKTVPVDTGLYRLLQNYLHSEQGVQINALMAACVWNLKKLTEKLNKNVNRFFISLFSPLFPKKQRHVHRLIYIFKDRLIKKK